MRSGKPRVPGPELCLGDMFADEPLCPYVMEKGVEKRERDVIKSGEYPVYYGNLSDQYASPGPPDTFPKS